MLKVIYIVGAGNSGSTIFSMALGGHCDITSIGEITGIYRRARLGELCSCGTKILNCSFWRDIILSTNQDKFFNAEGCYEDRLGAEESVQLYRRVAGKTGTKVIVDASKDSRRLINLSRNSPVDIQIIPVFLVRDGRAYIYSMRRRNAVGRRYTLSIFALWRWTLLNTKSLLALYLSGLRKISVRINYARFAAKPTEELAKVCEAVDLEYEEGMLDFWSQPHHNIAGTQSRFNPKPITPKNTWKKELPLRSKILFILLGGHLLNFFFGVRDTFQKIERMSE